jgi:hypothetical protein
LEQALILSSLDIYKTVDMKKLFLILFFGLGAILSFSQSDTLFDNKGRKITCKIHEINEFEIKYVMTGLVDGPTYVIDKSTVIRYTLANGYTEVLMPDELSLEHEHGEILANREVIKLHPFSFAFNHISLSYEKVIKVGFNLDVEVGYINYAITNNDPFATGYGNSRTSAFYTGAYVKPGVKFFLGQDFSVRGLKYAHPLKGRYVKLDLAGSFINYQGLQRVDYNFTNNTAVTNTVTSDLNIVAYGGFVNYGRQFILGNMLTLDYYVGLGFTGISYTYSNPEYMRNTNSYNSGFTTYSYATDARYISNYHGFMRMPNFGLSVTCGFRIGYILPSKPDSRKRPAGLK